MKFIELESVSKVYAPKDRQPIHALREIDLTINKGEFVVITGPSGSGKSSLLSIMGLTEVISEGSYQFAGQETAQLSESQRAEIRATRLGWVFQSFGLVPSLNVLENVAVGSLLSKERESSLERAVRALGKVGLDSRADSRISELSGGQQQRVGIARALAKSPEVIFADEPTGQLDYESGKNVVRAFRELNEEGQGIVMVTHDTASLSNTDRHLVLVDGRLLSND